MGGYPPPEGGGGLAFVVPEEPPRVPTYRDEVREGDRVRLPDGRAGTVYMIEIMDGHFKVVSVRPDKPKRRLFGLLPAIPLRFVETEIDTLVTLAHEAEVLRIMDDPVELGLEP